jgi:hypothetical protein
MSKHTPGPWEAVGCLVRTARTESGGGFLVAECPVTNEHRWEDARLIAAAPDLLAACEAAYEGDIDPEYLRAMLRAAIERVFGDG